MNGSGLETSKQYAIPLFPSATLTFLTVVSCLKDLAALSGSISSAPV